jgi:hypothetical protein
MSQFRVEKHRAAADLTLVTGTTVSGSFFLADSLPSRGGPERVGDLLNGESGFFPFEKADGTTTLYNRAHVVMVALPPGMNEAELDSGYDVATRRVAMMVLSTGARVAGTVAVYRPSGQDRLSDYARSDEQFRYVVSATRTLIVNCSHIVELCEVAD